MFNIGFTTKDLVRSVWAFLAGAAAYYSVNQNLTGKTLLAGLVTAGIVAVKNFLLADGSTVKG